MGPGDMPESEAPKAAEVKHAEAAREAHQQLLDEVMKIARHSKETRDGAHKDMPAIENKGQIERMVFPKGWIVGDPEKNPGIGTQSYQEVYRLDNHDTSVGFFYRGLPVDDGSAVNFRALLDQPPHALSADELHSLQRIIGAKTPSDSPKFTMTSAKTEDLNGKKVLVVEGSYPESGDHIRAIYIDADGSGRFVQEVQYQAPKAEYQKHMKEVQSALKSIEWK